jgi:hypothetical protein
MMALYEQIVHELENCLQASIGTLFIRPELWQELFFVGFSTVDVV